MKAKRFRAYDADGNVTESGPVGADGAVKFKAKTPVVLLAFYGGKQEEEFVVFSTDAKFSGDVNVTLVETDGELGLHE